MEILDVRELRPKTVVRRTFPIGETTLLIPISDTHVGSPGFASKKLKETISWGVDHNAFFVGAGDYVDFMSTGNRHRAISARLHDSTIANIDKIALERAEEFYDAISPSKGRWFGFLQGHHWWELATGITTDQKICEWMEAPFLGDCAMIHLFFVNAHRQSCTCRVWVHHGTGGGITQAAILNKLERIMAWVEADVYVMAHQHRMVDAVIDKLYTTSSIHPRLVHHQKVLVAAAGYLTAYTQGSEFGGRPQGSYAEKGVMAPAALGSPIIYVDTYKSDDEVAMNLGCHTGSLPR